MKPHEVVITGIGVVCPIGHSLESVTASLSAQRHGFCHLPEFANFKRSKIRIGTRVPDFVTDSPEVEDWSCPYPTPIPKDALRGLNPHSYYAYHATTQALQMAQLPEKQLGVETGLFTASAGSPGNLYRNLNEMHAYGVGRTNPFGIINSVVGTLSWNLSTLFSIEGAGCGFASACASSAHALGFAYDQIMLGRQERIVVVGAEDGDLHAVLPFAGMHALSTAEDPDAASLPFDRRRKGFVGCGGATTLILESAEVARRRGAPILAEFHGWGQTSDGYKPAAPLPCGSGLARAMTKALQAAEFSIDSIDYLNAHATGTVPGDLAELRAIRTVFGDSPSVPISSTKALTGHGLSFAGVLEVALTIWALRGGFIPGTANLEEPDAQADGLNLPKENQPASVRRFISNSSGFGGANVCLAFQLPLNN